MLRTLQRLACPVKLSRLALPRYQPTHDICSASGSHLTVLLWSLSTCFIRYPCLDGLTR
jgi:hypothetical protein